MNNTRNQTKKNQFLDHHFEANDRRAKRRREPEDLLALNQPRPQRRRDTAYNPVMDRHRTLQKMFDIACKHFWPRSVLYYAAYILDVYAATGGVTNLIELDLFAMAALLIAAKHEGDYNVAVSTSILAGILRRTYPNVTRTDVSMAEYLLLREIGLDRLGINHPYHLWENQRFHMKLFDQGLRDMTKFFIDCCTMDDRFISASPSRIVATSLWMAHSVLKRRWTRSMSVVTGFVPEELARGAEGVAEFLQNVARFSPLCKHWSSSREPEVVDKQSRPMAEIAGDQELYNKQAKRRRGDKTAKWVHPSEAALAFIGR